jgi:hypothetical protein
VYRAHIFDATRHLAGAANLAIVLDVAGELHDGVIGIGASRSCASAALTFAVSAAAMLNTVACKSFVKSSCDEIRKGHLLRSKMRAAMTCAL